MPRDDPFESKPRDAPGVGPDYARAVIRTVMNRADWGILLTLAVIWGAAFLFIDVAVSHVDPLTYVWLRLSIAVAAFV